MLSPIGSFLKNRIKRKHNKSCHVSSNQMHKHKSMGCFSKGIGIIQGNDETLMGFQRLPALYHVETEANVQQKRVPGII